MKPKNKISKTQNQKPQQVENEKSVEEHEDKFVVAPEAVKRRYDKRHHPGKQQGEEKVA